MTDAEAHRCAAEYASIARARGHLRAEDLRADRGTDAPALDCFRHRGANYRASRLAIEEAIVREGAVHPQVELACDFDVTAQAALVLLRAVMAKGRISR